MRYSSTVSGSGILYSLISILEHNVRRFESRSKVKNQSFDRIVNQVFVARSLSRFRLKSLLIRIFAARVKTGSQIPTNFLPNASTFLLSNFPGQNFPIASLVRPAAAMFGTERRFPGIGGLMKVFCFNICKTLSNVLRFDWVVQLAADLKQEKRTN